MLFVLEDVVGFGLLDEAIIWIHISLFRTNDNRVTLKPRSPTVLHLLLHWCPTTPCTTALLPVWLCCL
jgi:hypothetical protein